MKKIKILVVNDYASNALNFFKFLPYQVDAIYFSENTVISTVPNPKFFVKDDLIEQIKQIKDLSQDYDIFISFGWLAASICYLANVNYIMYFVNSFMSPSERLWKKMSFIKSKFFLMLFKDTLKNASKALAGAPHDQKKLNIYRKDATYIVPFINFEKFNKNIKKINFDTDEFIFFSPQRIEPSKGQLEIWKALEKTKSNFIVLQAKWGDSTTDYYNKVISKKPEKVQFIETIKHEKIASYYVSANAVIGQISDSCCGGIEREAIACGIPVFCCPTHSYTKNDPFYTKLRDIEKMAKYLDRIVLDKNYRNEYTLSQFKWLNDNFEISSLVNKWKKVIEESINYEYKTKARYDRVLKTFQKIS